MSKCCAKVMPMPMLPANDNCICSFPTLVILILIVLQFSRCNKGYFHDDDDDDDECETPRICNEVDSGILFIIALFFLSCVGCGRGYGRY